MRLRAQLAGFEGIRPAFGLLEEALDEAHEHYWFAERWHWTSDQVANEGAVRLWALRQIGEVKDALAADARRKQQRQQGAQGAT